MPCTPDLSSLTFLLLQFENYPQLFAFLPARKSRKQYVSPLETTNQRRSRISNNWFFDCKCDRCRDPTENGSYVSATRCLKCTGDGTVLPRNPLDQMLLYNNGESVDKLIEYFDAKLRNSGAAGGIEVLEELLSKAVKLFHPNHYMATMIRISLNQAYVNLALRVGDAHDIPIEVHMRRKELLDDIHQVIELVDPGLSRRRGTVIDHRLCESRMVALIIVVFVCCPFLDKDSNRKKKKETERFPDEEFIQLIEAEIETLKEGLECLKHSREGPGSLKSTTRPKEPSMKLNIH
ncbi:Msta [Caligus rogercresseyi]|uniref:Msta n=1 Tax=Caligus rogercresseyi TaxID=217165 RepID=A0A7T8QUZ8_CALRO|nr:Msta [Caligus rogercresseyi]